MKSHRATWASLSCAAALVLCLSDSRAQIGESNSQPASEKTETPANPPARYSTKPIWIGASHDRALAALRTKVDVNFDKTPLAEVAEWASKVGDIPVRIDRKALEVAGDDPDMTPPISLKLRGVSLKTALGHALVGLGLSASPRGDELLITTTDVAAARIVPRAYPVGDLLRETGSGVPRLDMEELIGWTTSCVVPVSWNGVGGSGTIAGDEEIMLVGQSMQIHEEVEWLLDSLRGVLARQQAGDFTPVSIRHGDSPMVCEALNKLVDFEAADMSLDEFAQVVRDRFGINVLLADVGVEPDAPLSGEFKRVPLRNVLSQLLGPHELTTFVGDEILIVTARGCPWAGTMLYPVRDLIAGSDNHQDKVERLIDMVASTISPQSWDHVGGSSSIAGDAPGHIMTISADRHVHDQIASLFAALRKAQARSNAPPQSDAALILKVYKLPKVEDPQLAKETAEGIAAIVRETIEPHSWRPGAESGPYMKALPGRLVIRHTADAHSKIRNLLRMLDSPEDVTNPLKRWGKQVPYVTGPIPIVGDSAD